MDSDSLMKFEKGFKKICNFNTFNNKDKKGLTFIINLLVIIILFIIILTSHIFKKKKYILYMLSLFLIILFANIHYYSQTSNQINILYGFSYIISSNVKTPEFLDLDKYFKNHTKFEKNYITYKNEVEIFLNNKGGVKNMSLTRDSFGGENNYIGSDVKINESGIEVGWRIMTLKVGDKITSKCSENFPSIAKTLKKSPEVVSCVLSVLEPGIMIPIHVGYYKGIIRYMLPLIVPDDRENCFLWVNGLKYSWENGKGVLWDDTYPHKVYNNTNQVRVLLYMDVIRPLNGFLRNLNLTVLKLIQNSGIVKDEIKRTEKKISINRKQQQLL
jgi:hypothetical protein